MRYSLQLLPDTRVITVTVHIPTDISEPPALTSVAVIDKGLERSIRLIEVPAVIQGHKVPGRPPERWPRDLFPLSRIA